MVRDLGGEDKNKFWEDIQEYRVPFLIRRTLSGWTTKRSEWNMIQ